MYWYHAILIFTSKLRDLPPPTKLTPQQYNTPTKIKISDPPSKYFSNNFNPPQSWKRGGGACYWILQKLQKMSMEFSVRNSLSLSAIFSDQQIWNISFLYYFLYPTCMLSNYSNFSSHLEYALSTCNCCASINRSTATQPTFNCSKATMKTAEHM